MATNIFTQIPFVAVRHSKKEICWICLSYSAHQLMCEVADYQNQEKTGLPDSIISKSGCMETMCI